MYLTEGPCSLDRIGEDIELSKASASIAARQLEKLGLVKRVWKKGDRKSYYRTADNIETALKSGLITVVLQKLQSMGMELDAAGRMLSECTGSEEPEAEFVLKRVERAKTLRDGLLGLLESPFVKLLG